jgi:hypothetical protein
MPALFRIFDSPVLEHWEFYFVRFVRSLIISQSFSDLFFCFKFHVSKAIIRTKIHQKFTPPSSRSLYFDELKVKGDSTCIP